MSVTIYTGDALQVLTTLPAESVQCIVTSPPYYGLRDYGHDGQLGLEATPEQYVANLVAVFTEARRVLRDDGVLWLNLGDSYAGSTTAGGGYSDKSTLSGLENPDTKGRQMAKEHTPRHIDHGLKPKDLIGIPWRVAFALQADGWYLRSDCIWHKPNPMPESVTDRPTKGHEYVFLLSKSARYFYDAGATAEDAVSDHGSGNGFARPARLSFKNADGSPRGNDSQWDGVGGTRNRRTVWTIPTRPYSEAHFAVMPPDLAEVCIKAGSAEGNTVLDPFGGAGTTGLVADRLGRDAVLIELNPDYAELARQRIATDAPMFSQVEVAQ